MHTSSFYFVTGNSNKYKEAKTVWPQIQQVELDLIEIQEIDCQKIIRHKLEEASKQVEGNIIVEDTSLSIAGLQGLPGPLVKWFLSSLTGKGLADLAAKSGNVVAIAKSIVGLRLTTGELHYFEGSINGTIVPPRGESGFGWDPIFQPDGYTKTFAELGSEEKSTFSMRKIAFKKMRDYILSNSEKYA